MQNSVATSLTRYFPSSLQLKLSDKYSKHWEMEMNMKTSIVTPQIEFQIYLLPKKINVSTLSDT